MTNLVPKCRKCKEPMRSGMAIQNTLAGLPDFPGDKTACTVSRTGPPQIENVWKCPKCGHSFSK